MESNSRVKTSRFNLWVILFLTVMSLYLAREVLVPIALAILFSFLLAPLVRQLERLRLPRVLAVLLTVLIAFSALGGIGYVVYNQFAELSGELPEYRQNIDKKLQSMRQSGGLIAKVRKAGDEAHHMLASPATTPSTAPTEAAQAPPMRVIVTNPTDQGQQSGSSPWGIIEMMFGKILGPFGTAVIVIVFSIFMLVQQEDLRDRVVRLVGRSSLTVTTEALDDAAARVSRYLLMQTIVNGSVGLLVFIFLWIVGKLNGHPFPQPALWGLLTALLRFIPYVGIWAAALMPMALSFAVYSSAKVSLETLGVYVLVEGSVANLIEPLLLGSSTGIATLAVLAAALFWAWLWGPVGLLLSTPLTVCVVVIGKYVPQLAFLNILLGDEPALSPPARLYERLLALNPDAAEDVAVEFSKDKPLVRIYDEMVLPALVLAEQDHDRGNLDPDRYQSILAGLRTIVEEMAERQHVADGKRRSEALVDSAKGKNVTPLTPLQAPKTADTPAHPAVKMQRDFQVPDGCKLTVACFAAHDEADEIAAVMLKKLLDLRLYCVILGPATSLASELATALENDRPDVLCVSAVPPCATSQARNLIKRLSNRMGDIPTVAGLWQTHGSAERVRERFGADSTVQVVTTLSDALSQIHQVAQPSLTRALTGDTAKVTSTPAAGE